jgi:hypothetical protein
MRRKDIVLSFSLMIFIALVSSCGQLTEGTPTPSATVSIEPVRSITPASSFTPLPTDSTTPTPTPAAIPTLPIKEAQTRLLQLLSDNGICRLPCFWGISPGVSTNKEAQVILVPLSSLSGLSVFKPEGGGILPRYTEDDLEIYTRVAFLTDPDHNVVNRIGFNAEAHRLLDEGGYEDVFDAEFFGEKVSAYSLSHVLTEKGVPPSVMIATFGGPLTRGGRGGFDILLLYPDQGILVNYTTQLHLVGANVRGCLQNAHVEMELYPPGQSVSFFEALEQTDWAAKMTAYRPLEEVTSMSVEEFYETFRTSTDQCLETPANLWPTPEP